MKKALVDLNVILDFLNQRNHHEEAERIIELCREDSLEGYVCAHEITTLSYFLSKDCKDIQKVKDTIAAILDTFALIPITETVLREALQSPVTDYEDAVIEVSALQYKVDGVISRNSDDFKSARLPCSTPEDFLRELGGAAK
jgi:predicted nucleic acid-binding protein